MQRRHFGHQRKSDRRQIKFADGDDDEIGKQPEPACLRAARVPSGGDHDQIGRGVEEAADRHLGDRRRLARALPAPERDDERREGEDHERVERLEPGDRNFRAEQVAVGVFARPQHDGVALLLVGAPEQADRQHQRHDRADRQPGLAADGRRARLAFGEAVLRQCRRGEQIDDEADGHADAGGGKAVVPAEFLAERAADQRRQKRAEIDADIEDREGAVAAAVAGRVEPADLGRDVRLEGAVAENEKAEREQKQMLEGHHEMADRHQRGAEDDGAALAEHAVGQQAAEDRREINEPGVEAVDLRGERLRRQRAEHEFQRAPERA